MGLKPNPLDPVLLSRFDTVGWQNLVPDMTHNVFGGTLNLIQRQLPYQKLVLSVFSHPQSSGWLHHKPIFTHQGQLSHEVLTSKVVQTKHCIK